MAKTTLTFETVIEIKRRLWNGELYETLAKEYSIAASSMRNILRGFRWASVPWPGKLKGKQLLGGMPDWRHDEIAEIRRNAITDSLRRSPRSKASKGEQK